MNNVNLYDGIGIENYTKWLNTLDILRQFILQLQHNLTQLTESMLGDPFVSIVISTDINEKHFQTTIIYTMINRPRLSIFSCSNIMLTNIYRDLLQKQMSVEIR